MPEKKSRHKEDGDATGEVKDVLEHMVREGARKILQAALEDEV